MITRMSVPPYPQLYHPRHAPRDRLDLVEEEIEERAVPNGVREVSVVKDLN